MDGLVYYAVCSTCGSEAQRSVARGPDATHAVRARDGKRVWRFPAGKYANPVVADEKRIFVTGRAHQFAMAPRGSEAAKEDAKADRARVRRQREREARRQEREALREERRQRRQERRQS
jgi:hypothetical protein